MLKVLNRPCSAAALPAPGAAAVTSSDETLVDRIARGDKLAMQTLFARHRTPVYRWLRRMVDETLAEDLFSMCGVRRAASRVALQSRRG